MSVIVVLIMIYIYPSHNDNDYMEYYSIQSFHVHVWIFNIHISFVIMNLVSFCKKKRKKIIPSNKRNNNGKILLLLIFPLLMISILWIYPLNDNQSKNMSEWFIFCFCFCPNEYKSIHDVRICVFVYSQNENRIKA